MGQITIIFIGLCTHLEDAVEGVAHRVVLVHEEQEVTINGVRVLTHAPFLRRARGEVVAGTLNSWPRRVSLSIANATGDPPSYDELYRCAIPQLLKLGGAPLVLNRSVTHDGHRPANVYFDLDHGAFSAGGVPRGASAATVVVETDGEPRLRVTTMDGGAALEEVELTSGSVLELHNTTNIPEEHHDGDFLLHYEVFEKIPPSAGYPMTPVECPGLPPILVPDVELGPGCSNSTYP